MSNTPPQSNPSSDWASCPEGALQGLGQRLRTQHARRQQTTAIRTAAGVLAAAAVLVAFFTPVAEPPVVPVEVTPIARINCRDCQDRFDMYQAHLAGEAPMADERVAETETHLNRCGRCRNKFVESHPEVVLPATVTSAALLLFFTTGLVRRRDR